MLIYEIVVNYLWKFLKKHNKVKVHSITCMHIWHINTYNFLYWWDKHFMKIWWSYLSPNTIFCDIIFNILVQWHFLFLSVNIDLLKSIPKAYYPFYGFAYSFLFSFSFVRQKKKKHQSKIRLLRLLNADTDDTPNFMSTSKFILLVSFFSDILGCVSKSASRKNDKMYQSVQHLLI